MKQFKRIYVETTNSCNLSCGFCPGTSRPPQFLTAAQFDHIVNRLGDCSKHLYFHVLGEPLLHPGLPAFLDIAHDHGKFVNLVTNGALIGKAGGAIARKPALRQVTFSMHSLMAHPAEHAGAQFENVKTYCGPIIDFTRKAQKDHFISYRLWPENESTDHGTWDALINKIEKEFTLSFSLRDKLKTTSAVPLDKNVFLNVSGRFEWPDMNAPDYGETGSCLGLREQLAVLVDGTVVPCCLDRNADIALGNIFTQPLSEILESERAVRIAAGFSQRKDVEELCRRCGYRKRFDRTKHVMRTPP